MGIIYDIRKILFGDRKKGLSIDMGTQLCLLGKCGTVMHGYGQGLRLQPGGARWKRVKCRYLLHPSCEPNPHVVISGMSGFGKSTLFKSILRNIVDARLSCIVFDAHDEHDALVTGLGGRANDPQSSGINILSLDGASVSERTSELVRTFKGVYSLGYIQATKLSECLWYTYRRFGARSSSDRFLEREPKIGDLLYEISIFVRNSKSASERNSLMHLKDKISNLNIAALSKNVVNVRSMRTGLHSFSLSGIRSKEAQVIYIGELLSRLYALMKEDPKDGKIRQYIMIDEAQFLINSSDESGGIITRFIEEGRKYGRAVVIVTHSSATLNRQIVANASTFISFYAREPSEVSFVSKVMAGGQETEHMIRSKIGGLGRNEAIVITANDRAPRVVSTAELHKRVSMYGGSEGTGLVSASARAITIERLCIEMSAERAEIMKLIERHMLDLFVFHDGQGAGEEWVMRAGSNPSIEHEVMVIKIHKTLSDAGIGCYVFDRARGPDVVAHIGEGRVAIEYETGHKNVEESLAMFRSRMPAYKRVIVLVNDHYLKDYAKTRLENVVFAPASCLKDIAVMLKGGIAALPGAT